MADDFLDRTPPHNIDAERAVLAAMILDKEVVEDVLAGMGADAFYRPAHQKIFNAMAEMAQKGISIDQLTLADHLDALGQLDEIGGKAYILEIANNSVALANWQSHMSIVKNDAILRELINAAVHIEALGFSSTDDSGNVVEESEKLLFDVTNKRIDTNFKSISDLMHETTDLLDKMSASDENLMGITTGFKDLDNVLGGMRAGDLIVLGARTSVGKTSLALNIAVNAAKAGATVAFFSLEMPAVQLTQRILASEAKVDSKKLIQRPKQLSDSDWQAIVKAGEALDKCEFYIDDSPGLSILQLRAKARRQLRHVEQGHGLVVVDYLQIMQAAHRGGGDQQRYLEVGEISRGLKVLAKELGMPVIALCQLSRTVETRPDKHPQLSDLRESGSIEQDADVVLFIDRSTSEEEAMNPKRPELGVANLIIGKNRNGALGTVDMVFIPEYTTFREAYRD